ncbi:hypothetical protein DID80_00745 [Candidatus Marinamargulisbacteria bacterium SCGC AAA071-K20]|nr:hypothetical protein DID80_00745 [Candidatus Marinamargulisbacteria bacterium SCGC AAA071-K20]
MKFSIVFKLVILLFTFLTLSEPVYSQAQFDSSKEAYKEMFESMVFDSSAKTLEGAIMDVGRRHAIYSYNLVNASTPGFTPYLFPDDSRELANMAPTDMKYFSKVLVEHMTTKMAENSKRQSAYYALYRKKMDNYRMVVTFGKK